MPLKQASIVQALLKLLLQKPLYSSLNNHCSGPNHRHAHRSSIFVIVSLSAKAQILRVSFQHTIKQTAITL